MDKKVRGWKILKLAVPDEITDSKAVNILSDCKTQGVANDVVYEEMEPVCVDIDLPALDVSQVGLLMQDNTMEYYEVNGEELLSHNQNLNEEGNLDNNQEFIPEFNVNEIHLN